MSLTPDRSWKLLHTLWDSVPQDTSVGRATEEGRGESLDVEEGVSRRSCLAGAKPQQDSST